MVTAPAHSSLLVDLLQSCAAALAGASHTSALLTGARSAQKRKNRAQRDFFAYCRAKRDAAPRPQGRKRAPGEGGSPSGGRAMRQRGRKHHAGSGRKRARTRAGRAQRTAPDGEAHGGRERHKIVNVLLRSSIVSRGWGRCGFDPGVG